MPKTTKELVKELQSSDLKVREVATLLGVTTQRVYQILDELREEQTQQEDVG